MRGSTAKAFRRLAKSFGKVTNLPYNDHYYELNTSRMRIECRKCTGRVTYKVLKNIFKSRPQCPHTLSFAIRCIAEGLMTYHRPTFKNNRLQMIGEV